MARTRENSGRPRLAVHLFLVLVTVAAYARVRDFAFVSYDDPLYVSANPHITGGLTASAVQWAFTSGDGASWYPLTRLSHMTDWQLWGADAGKHHLTNLILHVGSALLLFELLLGTTGALWLSAAAAALFALHPLNVESVAWVAERKGALSTFFWMLTCLAYVSWVRNRGSGRLALVIVSYLLGLLAKPMLVTLPLVLLLLDFWPLARLSAAPPGRGRAAPFDDRPWARPRLWAPLVMEKVPLAVLAVVMSAITWVVQSRGGALSSVVTLPLAERLRHVPLAYVSYLASAVWPVGLAVHYPYELGPPLWSVAAASLFLALVSAAVVWTMATAPYAFVGWFWFLVTLVPVCGLIQVGDHFTADRYSYVPSIGLFLLAVWGIADLKVARARPWIPAAAAAVALVACFVATRQQVEQWSSSAALYAHAIAVTPGNAKAHAGLGTAWLEAGRVAEAEEQFRAALGINPDNGDAHANLATILQSRGDLQGAADHARRAVDIGEGTPNAWKMHSNLASILQAQGASAAAEAEYRRAVELEPQRGELRFNLGTALQLQGRSPEAIAEFERALALDPTLADARTNLAVALVAVGRREDAVAQFTEVVRLRPGSADARYYLGAVLLQLGRRAEAAARLREALQLQPDHPGARAKLEQATNG